LTLDTFTTAPRREMSDCAASRISLNGARTFTAIITSQPSSVVSSTLPVAMMPAAFTSASIAPNAPSAALTIAAGAPALVTSACSAAA
jgi:hypothetical protein